MTGRVSARRVALVGLVLVALLAPATGTLSPSPATAEPSAGLSSARERAATLRAEVAALEERVEVANEDYNEAGDELAQAVSTQIEAERRLAVAEQESHGARDHLAERARSLYMGGGPAALYASVLDGRSLGDVFDRVEGVRAVVNADARHAETGRSAVRLAAREQATLAGLADQRVRLERRSARTAEKIESLLGRRQALLAAADGAVRREVAAQKRAAEAAAARRAATMLARAEASAADLSGQMSGAPGTPYARQAIASALAMLGRPYQWGAVGPATFDCSGLTGWAYRHAGVSLPRTSREQWYAGRHVPLADLAPGDLLFWATNTSDPGSIHHVALYLGDGRMVHAPHTGDVVRVAAVYLDGYIGAVRPAA